MHNETTGSGTTESAVQAAARTFEADQGVLTGGTVAARVEAGLGRADSTPTRGAPLASLGLGGVSQPRVGRWDDAIRVRSSMATMATMATPRARLSKKKIS